MALLKQIWIRSPAFFRALDDIKGFYIGSYKSRKDINIIQAIINVIKIRISET